MKIHSLLFSLCVLLLFFSCVGGTLGNITDLEEYPLRAASDKEGKGLKRCLQGAHAAQEKALIKTGKYRKKISELPIDDECNGYIMGMKFMGDGYEIMAQFHESESTVRWTVNDEGVIEEHLDTQIDEDIGFE